MRIGATTLAVIAALTAAAIFAPAAPAAYLKGSVEASGGIKLQTNPKTRHVRIEARYLRLHCSDGVDTGGISPDPIKTRFSKRGRFSEALSGPNEFFYVRGRIHGDRAQGTLFWWIQGAPTRPEVMCTSQSETGPGVTTWSARVPEF